MIEKKNFSLRYKFLLSLTSIFIFFILLEIGLRLGGWGYIFFRKPHSNLKKLQQGDKVIILCVGDSYTFGIGVPYQYSYPQQLKRLLNQNLSEKRFYVYNLGRPQANCPRVLEILRKNINRYHPDLVIVLCGANDWVNWSGKEISLLPLSLTLLDARLSRLRTYMLFKIAFINLKSRFYKNNKIFKNRSDSVDIFIDVFGNFIFESCEDKQIWRILQKVRKFIITGESKLGLEEFKKVIARDKSKKRALYYVYLGGLLMYCVNEYDLAVEQFKKALKITPNSACAHYGLIFFYQYQKRYDLMLKEIRKFYSTMGEDDIWWSNKEMGQLSIGLIIDCLKWLYENGQISKKQFYTEIGNLRETIKKKFKRKKAKTFDRLCRLIMNKQIVYALIEKDLFRIMQLLKENGISLVLQTYPGTDQSDETVVIRRFAQEFHIPLVDNKKIFPHKLKTYRWEELFLADGHCTALGNKIIAENVYNVLTKINIHR